MRNLKYTHRAFLFKVIIAVATEKHVVCILWSTCQYVTKTFIRTLQQIFSFLFNKYLALTPPAMVGHLQRQDTGHDWSIKMASFVSWAMKPTRNKYQWKKYIYWLEKSKLAHLSENMSTVIPSMMFRPTVMMIMKKVTSNIALSR